MYRNASYYFAAALVVALLGFFSTYLTQLSQTDGTRHLHGMVAFGWMLLLVAQPWLIRTRRVRWHRLLGKLSLPVAVLLVVSGLLVTHAMLHETGRGFVRAFGDRLAFLDVTSLAYFIWTYAMGLRHRRTLALHARYLAATAVLLLPPAIARAAANNLPMVHGFLPALHLSYVVTELVTLALLASDRRIGAPRAPYLALLGFTLFQHASVVLVPQWDQWAAVCRWYGAL